MRPRYLVSALLVLAFGSSVGTQAPHSCVVIVDDDTGATFRTDVEACRTRLSPASTFKIPHALVALEIGAVTADSVERWDGTPHPARPEWNADHTVLTSLRPSVLWFFQRIAPRIGAERMETWLHRFGYGNASTSGDITRYWINGQLLVSPDEQAAFLRRFYAGDLPVARVHQDAVRDALVQQPGTVENATGVHPLGVRWRDGLVLNAKTGATSTPNGRRISWLVGALIVDGRRHVFASAVWRDEGPVDALDGARQAVQIFVERGLLDRSTP